VTIGVSAINDAPVAVDDSYTVDEDNTLTVDAPGVLGNDSDAEGDGMTALPDTDPSNGTVVVNEDGSFTYTPDAHFNGSDSFTYRASDGAAQSSPATVTITVNPMNDAPVAVNDNYSTDEDTPLDVDAPGVLGNDIDVDGDVLSAVLVDDVSSGTLTLNADGSFTYTPNANYNGMDSFTYKANDGTDDSNVVAVTIGVSAINDAPVAVDDSYTVDEDNTLDVNAPGVLANDSDVDGNALSAELVAGPSSGALSLAADGSFIYTPAVDFNGSDSFTYRASDGTLQSDLATVSITVNPVNDLPVAICQDVTKTADGGCQANVAPNEVDNGSSDPDGEDITLSLSPSGPYSVGATSVTLTVTDGQGASATCTAIVTVEDKVAPAVVTQDITIQLDDTGNASITAVQVDDGSSDACGIASIAVAPDAFTCANMGANTVTLTVTDVSGNVATGTATVTVEDHIKPVITCPAGITLEANAGCSATYYRPSATATDNCDPDPAVTSDPPLPATFTGVGTYTITYTATDASGNISDPCVQTVTVVDVLPPIITLNTPEGTDDPDITLDCGISSYEELGATAIDSCDGPVDVTIDASDVDTSACGTYDVICGAIDAAGNEATEIRVVTVQDTTAPQVTAAFDRVPKTGWDDDSSDGSKDSRDDKSDGSRDSDDGSSGGSGGSGYYKDRFALRYSATDACDPDPDIGGVILLPDSEGMRIIYKDDDDGSSDDASSHGSGKSKVIRKQIKQEIIGVHRGVLMPEVPVGTSCVAGMPRSMGIDGDLVIRLFVDKVRGAHVHLRLLILRIVDHIQPGALRAVIGVVGVLVVSPEEHVQVAGRTLMEEPAADRVVRSIVGRSGCPGAIDPLLEDEVGRPGQRGLIAGEVHEEIGRIEHGGRTSLILNSFKGRLVQALEIHERIHGQAVHHVALVGVGQTARGTPVGIVPREDADEVARAVGQDLGTL